MNEPHPTPTHPDPELLTALAEGEELPSASHAALDAHLATCPACRDEVAWIRSLRHEAALLPREVPLPPGSFRVIRERIEEGPRSRVRPLRAGVPPYPMAWLAAAAVLLVALSSGLTLQLARGPASSTGGIAAGIEGSSAEPDGHFASSGAEVAGVLEAAWGPTLSTLEAALLRGRHQLHPETIEVVEASLRTIDDALAEARAALEADPGNPEATRALNGAYESRAQLLRQATSLLPGA